MALGKKLYDLRAAKNLTKQRLAQELGVSKTAYGKWENDLAKPSFDNISIICDFHNISKDELMSKEKYINHNNHSINNFPNLIHSRNRTITIYLPHESIEKVVENQKQISEMMLSQNLLLQELISKK